MKVVLHAALLAFWLAAGAFGQEVRKPADWQKMYQDASAQLQAAQDRKAEMAAENGKLAAKVAQLQQDLQTAQNQIATLGQRVDDVEEQQGVLEAFYQGWQSFLAADPLVSIQWHSFWGNRLPALPDRGPIIFEPNWPLTVR